MARIEPKTMTLPGGRHGEFCLVRSAVPEDAAAMLEHRRRAVPASPYIVTEPAELDHDVEKQRHHIIERLESDGQLLLVAEVFAAAEQCPGDGSTIPLQGEDAGGDGIAAEGMIIGTLGFTAGSRRRIAHQGTFGLMVDPEWRGRGVGRAMITTLLDWAAAHPVIEKVGLGVFVNNERARALYEQLGFVEEGRSVRFARLGPGHYMDDISMCIFVKPGAPAGFKIWGGGT
jgi:RimJ/RimL family protein N-acetyltransferase